MAQHPPLLDDVLGIPLQQWTVVGVWFKPETDGFIPVYMVNVINADTAELAVMVFIKDCVDQHGVGSEDDVGICSVFRGSLTPVPEGDWLPEPEDTEIVLTDDEPVDE